MKRTILITGATAGIGEATARRFAEDGWTVIATGRRAERLRALKNDLESAHQTRIIPLAFDISDRDATEAAVRSLPDDVRPIDVLVNNAGLALGREPLQDGDPDDWDTMIDTNVKGLLYISRVVAADMKARGDGHIINLSSIAAKEVYPNGNVYCATKHAVDALTKGMRLDLLPHGVRVTAIAPGMVETEFSKVRYKGDDATADQVYDGFTPLTGSDVADMIHFAATRPKHVCINDLLVMATDQGNAVTVRRS